VVKIDAKDLPYITIADSEQESEIGDTCAWRLEIRFGIGQNRDDGYRQRDRRANVGIGLTVFYEGLHPRRRRRSTRAISGRALWWNAGRAG